MKKRLNELLKLSVCTKILLLDKSQPSKIEEAHRVLSRVLEIVIKEIYIKKAA